VVDVESSRLRTHKGGPPVGPLSNTSVHPPVKVGFPFVVAASKNAALRVTSSVVGVAARV